MQPASTTRPAALDQAALNQANGRRLALGYGQNGRVYLAFRESDGHEWTVEVLAATPRGARLGPAEPEEEVEWRPVRDSASPLLTGLPQRRTRDS